jgi:hypothetical protein
MGTRLSLRPPFQEGNVDAQLRARRAARSHYRIQPQAASIENNNACIGVPTLPYPVRPCLRRPTAFRSARGLIICRHFMMGFI